MRHPFNARAPTFDAKAINETIRRALACAGLGTTSSPLHDLAARIVIAGDVGGESSNDRPSTGKVEAPGTFENCQFSNGAGTRSYKLYVPAAACEAPRPVVVMLHGCTQSADDFAAGTQMNRLAEEHGFLVVYPEQPAQANMSKCWNWFQPQDQVRDAGEPSLIAGIVGEVAARHGADRRRVFVAGLSAGGAMAVVLGETYADLFAGVGVHSGLPYGSAHDIPSAMAAMKGGRSGWPGLQAMPKAAARAPRKAVQAVPTIVFHGDRDHTVQQTNGVEIVQQAREACLAEPGASALSISTQRGTAAGGRSFSRTVHADDSGQAHIEDWTIHGAGHAWSGGDARGSYTDGTGPDASAEMVRFFLALPRAGSA